MAADRTVDPNVALSAWNGDEAGIGTGVGDETGSCAHAEEKTASLEWRFGDGGVGHVALKDKLSTPLQGQG